MLYKTKPKNFNPKFEVNGCFIEFKGEILLLCRQDHKPQPNALGIPGGKLNKLENVKTAMTRELKEETGLKIAEKKINFFRKVFVRYPEYDFIYYIFHTKLEVEPEIKINTQEHKNFCWITPRQALKMDLIEDLDGCIKLFYKL